jgi:AraC-like DNA-binding protein
MMKPKLDKPRGVLGRQPVPGDSSHGRYHASPDLAFFVEHYWTVRWELAGAPAQRVETLPHPSVHLVFERGATELGGVQKGKFSRLLEGNGFVFAVKFRPASFHGFYRKDLATLTNRRIHPAKLFGEGFHLLEKKVLSAASTEERIALTEAYLRARLPREDPRAKRLNDLAARIAQDTSLTRAEQLPALCGIPLRQLQRLFRRYVGVSPKWVIMRYRIHEALAQVHENRVGNWAGLALDLGYADQAHFIRDFKSLVGVTPRTYRARIAR